MPYINTDRRKELDSKMSHLLNIAGDLSDGELNYVISNILNHHIESKRAQNNFNYALCNKLIGVLECAKIELYNRVITPYENNKIKENGKLYHSFSFFDHLYFIYSLLF